MPKYHYSRFTRSRRHFSFMVCLTAVFINLLSLPVLAASLSAYQAGGSLVFRTDGGSVANSHGATIGRIEGNSYYQASGSLAARLEDQKLYNSSGSLVAKFEGASIYNSRGSLVGKLDNESLSDSHGATIGRIEGAGGLEDPATFFLACLLLGIL